MFQENNLVNFEIINKFKIECTRLHQIFVDNYYLNLLYISTNFPHNCKLLMKSKFYSKSFTFVSLNFVLTVKNISIF